MNLDTVLINVRLVLVAVLLAYTFVPSLRLYATRALLGVGGILLLSFGLVSLGSPTALGYSDSYMLIGDSLTLIEGGILAVVLSAELSARRTRLVATSLIYARSLFGSQPRKLVYYPFLLRAEILKSQFLLKPLLTGDRAPLVFEGPGVTRTALNKAPP